MTRIWLDSRPWDSTYCIGLTKFGVTRPPLRCRHRLEEGGGMDQSAWCCHEDLSLARAMNITTVMSIYAVHFRTCNCIQEA